MFGYLYKIVEKEINLKEIYFLHNASAFILITAFNGFSSTLQTMGFVCYIKNKTITFFFLFFFRYSLIDK